MKTLWKKALSLTLAFIMVFQLLPTMPIVARAEGVGLTGKELDEARRNGLVEQFISQPEQQEYTAEDVLGEVQELRQADVKHFTLSNGNTLAVTYGYPVHVQAEDGSFQDIDNRLALYNADGTLSEKEPDALLKVWLEEQKALAEQEETNEASEPDPVEDPVIQESPSEEPVVEEQPEPTEDDPESSEEPGVPGEEPPAEEAGEESSEPSDEEPPAEADPSEEAQNEESGETPTELELDTPDVEPSEPDNPADDSAEDPSPDVIVEEESTQTETAEAEHGLGPVPEDLPVKIPGPDDSRYYSNTNGIANISFAVLSSADQMVRFSYGDYSVCMTPQVLVSALKPGEIVGPAVGRIDAMEEDRGEENSLESAILPHNIRSSLTYQDVFRQTDLQYILTETALKENIVIKERGDSYVYTFLLETNGLKPVLTENGSIELLDEEGICVMWIPTGYMTDAKGEESASVRYELWQRGTQTYLSVLPDSEWINAEERTFPVTIDPTVMINWDTSIEISTISKANPDTDHDHLPYPTGTNYDSRQMGYVGHHNGSLGKMRSLIHVGTLPTIPENSTIIKSYLKLRVFRFFWWDRLSMDIEAYALTSNQESNGSWCKYHTWNDCPALSDNVLDFHPVWNSFNEYGDSSEYNYFRLDVTREAINWYNDPSTNYGICLKAIDEDTMSNGWFGYALIASSDVPYANIQRPFFIVEYRNTAGLEERLSYQSQNIGRAGTAYVGDYTAQLTLVKGDAGAASTVNPVSVEHTYNSAYCAGEYGETIPYCTGLYSNMKLGSGWKLNYQQSVTQMNSEYLVYTDADGSLLYFNGSGSTYHDEDGLGLTITVSGSNYTMTDRSDNTTYFENGLLSYSQSANGNRVTVVRNDDGQITSITRMNNGASEETVATLSYDENGFLTGITNSAGKTTSYGYDSTGHLTTVTHPDGTSVSYTYDAAGRMLSASDNEALYSVSYSYNSNTGKITGFSEAANGISGGSVSVDNSQNGVKTYRSSGPDMTLNTNDDLLTTCVFDYWGRTINSYTTNVNQDSLYGVSAAKYTANSGTSAKNNRLLVSSTAGVQYPNMVADPGAEGMSSIGTGTSPWNATGTASVETGTKRTGAKALKLNGNGSIKQSVTGLDAGAWYVLSAYVYIDDTTSFSTGGGVYMASGATQGDLIYWSTKGVGDGWERIYVAAQADGSGNITLAATASGMTGSAIFDDFQLEKTPFGSLGTPSAASLIDNGAIERSDSWNVWVSGYHTVGEDDGLDGKGLHITGTAYDCIDIYQNIRVNLKGEHTYLFSGWAKGDSVPMEITSSMGPRCFCLAYQLFYEDNTTELKEMNFNVQTSEWQYLVFPIVPDRPDIVVDTVQIMVSFGRNPNTVVFDNLTLTREDAQTFTYNENGELTSVVQPGTDAPTYSYSGADLISQVTRGSGTYNYSYDSHHNLTGVTNDGLNMASTYDSRGNSTSSTLTGTGTSLQVSTSATYDTAGDRVLSETDARSNSVTYEYSTAVSQMMGKPTKTTDATGTSGTSSFNENNGRITGTQILDGTDEEAALAYSYQNGYLAGLSRTAELPGGSTFTQSYGMSYNAFGQTTGINVGTVPLVSYTYSPNGGALQSMQYGNGDSVSYSYDKLERVQNVYYNGNSEPALTYGYAANGALGSMTDHSNNRRYVYSYDGLDRLLSMTEAYNGSPVQLYHAGYDKANRISGTTYKVSPAWNGTLRGPWSYGYSYSSTNGSLTEMSLPNSESTSNEWKYSYSYDGLRRLSNRSLIHSYNNNSSTVLSREYSYLAGSGTNDTTTLVSSLTNKKGNGTTLNSWTYTYDAAGRITSINDGTTTRSYTYDTQGQMLSESIGGVTTSYVYDAAGNIRSKTSGGSTVSYSYGNSQWRDLLTAYNGQSITYDAIGNPTKWYNGTTMTWTRGRQLASISAVTNVHGAMSFTYNSDGLRLTKTEGTGSSAVNHRYTWQGNKLIAESFDTTELEFFYDESGQPYALLVRDLSRATPTEAWYFYVTNLQGDVVMLLDASGTTVAEYNYDAWGKVLSFSGSLAEVNPLRYRGYYYDRETGLYYLQSRYYDPEIGRFINADTFASTGQGILGCNMFAYCGNEPVIRADPSGQFPWWIIPLVLPLFLSGCGDSSSPPDYQSNNDRRGACYEYAGMYIGIEYSAAGDTDPGTYSARHQGIGISQLPKQFTLDVLSAFVMEDFNTLELQYTKYDSYDLIPDLASDEVLIACMQYTTKKGDCDYHFAVRLSNGEWADKPSTRNSRHGVLSFDGRDWVDEKGLIIGATADTTCFFVVKVG